MTLKWILCPLVLASDHFLMCCYLTMPLTFGVLIPKTVRRGFPELLEAEVSALTGALRPERCSHQRSTHRTVTGSGC